jgi:hypothetical protein
MKNTFPRLFATTARHPDNKALLDALGASLTLRNTCGGKHTRGRSCSLCGKGAR